jgi:hypothetical protein
MCECIGSQKIAIFVRLNTKQTFLSDKMFHTKFSAIKECYESTNIFTQFLILHKELVKLKMHRILI